MSEQPLGTGPTGISESLTLGGDLVVNRIGFGAMRLTGDQVWGDYPDRERGMALLRSVVDLGVTFIDTADVYGPHTNESLIREALYPYPPDLVIATKGGFVRGGFDYSTLGAVGNPNYLRQCAQMSLRRLGVERIDLYYLHSGRATDATFEDQVQTLAALRDEGVIRHIGLSNVSVEQLRTAQTIVDIAAVTAHYNAGIRTGAPFLEICEREGVIFSPWHPVSIYEGQNAELVRSVVGPIAQAHEATESQIALAWQLHHSSVVLPIPGTTNVGHLEENLAAQEVRLSPEEVDLITDLVSEG
jgi:pyridoxine 4-dehydrogenase